MGKSKKSATETPDATVSPPPVLSSRSQSSTSIDSISDFNMETFSSLDGKPLPTVHVNPASLAELKTALDAAVKKIISTHHQFKEIHTHTDVRLGLGWTSVAIAAGTVAYSYKAGFEQSKGVVLIGCLCYAVLAFLQFIYAYYVEGDKIYVGKRKTVSKRIETEVLQISSCSISPQSSLFWPTTASKATIPPASSSSSSSSPSDGIAAPKYSLSLSYRRSTNANKSLLRRKTDTMSLEYGALVDENGGIEEARVGDWLAWALGKLAGNTGEMAALVFDDKVAL